MAESIDAIQMALAEFDRRIIRERVELGEEERTEALTRFPLDSWADMTLDRYALGTEHFRDSFCYWMEWGTRDLGSIFGGTSKKHIIFRRHSGDWFFPANYVTLEEAWDAVHKGWMECFEDAGSGSWSDADAIPALQLGKSLQVKALHVYFKDELLPISSAPHLTHFAELTGVQLPENPRIQRLELNRALLAALRSLPEGDGWTTTELAHFLYERFAPARNASLTKIAPGEQARYWDECLAGGYICVGWDEVGDLREFSSQDEFEARFTNEYLPTYAKNRSTTTKKAREVWSLLRLEPGDLVVANKGKSEILAVGTVVEPGYVWDEERPDYKHTVTVDWDTSYAKEIPIQTRWAMVTVAPVRGQLRDLILEGGQSHEPVGVEPDSAFLDVSAALAWKNQALLYGPPGTGKTYTARRFAVWWLLGETEPIAVARALEGPAAFKALEERLVTKTLDRRTWWMVASPAEWSWEQLFVDGTVDFRNGRLSRNYPLVQVGDLVIGYESTPTKKIVAVARVTRDASGPSVDGRALSLEPASRVQKGLNYAELLDDPILAQSEPMRFRNQGTLFALTDAETEHLLSLLLERDPSLEPRLRATTDEGAVGQITNLTFHPSFSYEDFIEGFRPVKNASAGLSVELTDGILKRVCRAAQSNSDKRFLVVIDGLNRAHVAKVFGEIITLLERDKRGMKVILPQSKEPFTIPPNVYLLGTMNTADRSIKLLDAALRRRFAFVELMPDTSNVSPLYGESVGGTLPLDTFLDGLNAKIAASEGREKQIGHSFFLDGGSAVTDPEAFARIFRQEVLPLLQEYCYEDYATLSEYLGDELVDGESQTLRTEVLSDPEQLVDVLTRRFVASGT